MAVKTGLKKQYAGALTQNNPLPSDGNGVYYLKFSFFVHSAQAFTAYL